MNLDEPLTLQIFQKHQKKIISQGIKMAIHHQPRSDKSLKPPNTYQSQEGTTPETVSSAHKVAVKRSNAKGVIETVFYEINHNLCDINLVQVKN
jgi:hypothetical protein